MHGRKKEKKETTEAALKLAAEKLAARSAKAAKYGAVIAGIAQRRAARLHDATTLDMIAKVLELNPEYYSLWNFRKEILQEMLPAGDNAAGGGEQERFAALRAEELRLTLAAIGRQPKSYAAWYHRKWVLARGHCDLAAELALCAQFLAMDERNFHCWSYRRAVLALMLEGELAGQAAAGDGGGPGGPEGAAAAAAATRAAAQAASELAFSSEKLEQNFSNYSAFHHRTTLLRDGAATAAALDGDGGEAATWRAVVGAELETVQQAVFTEPDDQSAWMYFGWLLEGVAGVDSAKALRLRAGAGGELDTPGAEERAGLLREQLEVLQELLSEEEGCKWALLTIANIQSLLAQLCAAGGGDTEATATLKQECTANLVTLVEVDPDHKEYYAYRQQQVAAAE
jgi:geranylgeranyl transferase type-2 subunit alpha